MESPKPGQVHPPFSMLKAGSSAAFEALSVVLTAPPVQGAARGAERPVGF